MSFQATGFLLGLYGDRPAALGPDNKPPAVALGAADGPSGDAPAGDVAGEPVTILAIVRPDGTLELHAPTAELTDVIERGRPKLEAVLATFGADGAPGGEGEPSGGLDFSG